MANSHRDVPNQQDPGSAKPPGSGGHHKDIYSISDDARHSEDLEVHSLNDLDSTHIPSSSYKFKVGLLQIVSVLFSSMFAILK